MPSTVSVTTKEIAGKVSESAYVLGVQPNIEGAAALYRMKLSDIRGSSLNDAYVVPLLLREYGAPEAFRMFVQGNADAPNADIARIVDRFYTAAAKVLTETYSSNFYLFNTSNSSNGTKGDDNANLSCLPSTNATAGQDDYTALPLFMCYDCNYTIDTLTLEPIITAIKGIVGKYNATPADSLVGVIQMTGWVKRTTDATTKTVSYRAQKADGYMPLPESVRYIDNSVRGFVLHAKYAAGYNSGGKLSSVSGVQPTTYRPGSAGTASISHDGQINLWRQWGTQYCGSSLCDYAFYQLMLEIKYAKLGSAAVMAGCRNYYYGYLATVSETGANRILLTTANGATLVPGSRVSLGMGTDRAVATCYNVRDIATIDRIETVNISGTNYSAVYLDTLTTFNTEAGITYITTQPWLTGSTDTVPGNDGSPTSNSSGKEPFKIQGIEVMVGTYEVPADTSVEGNGVDAYNVWLCRKASNLVSGNVGAGAVQVGTIPNPNTTAAWKYTAELNWQSDNEAYMLQKQDNAASSNGYQSAFYKVANNSSSLYEWLAFGYLNSASIGGLACANLSGALSGANWYVAARASGSGGNRGEYSAAPAAE